LREEGPTQNQTWGILKYLSVGFSLKMAEIGRDWKARVGGILVKNWGITVLQHLSATIASFAFQNQFWGKLQFLAFWKWFSQPHIWSLSIYLFALALTSERKFTSLIEGFQKSIIPWFEVIQTIFFIQITFDVRISKHKSLYINITFNQNQFHKINSPHYTTKHTLTQKQNKKRTSATTRPHWQQQNDHTTTTIVNSERDLKQANLGQRTERKRHKESFTFAANQNTT